MNCFENSLSKRIFIVALALLPLLLSSAAQAIAVRECVDAYTDPIAPGQTLDLLADALDIVVQGDLMFTLDDAGKIGFVDIQDPLAPTLIFTILNSGGVTLQEAGDWLYVAAGNGNLHAVDVSDPYVPILHPDVLTGVNADIMAFSDGKLLVAEAGSNLLRLYDCADPTGPIYAESISMLELTEGNWDGEFHHLGATGSSFFAAGQVLLPSGYVVVVTTRMEVSVEGNALKVQPADYHSIIFENSFGLDIGIPDGDFVIQDGKAYLAFSVYQCFYGEDEYFIIKKNNIYAFDVSEVGTLSFLKSIGENKDGLPLSMWPVGIGLPGPGQIAVSAAGQLSVLNLNEDLTLDFKVEAPADLSLIQAGPGFVIGFENVLHQVATYDVSLAGIRLLIDQYPANPLYEQTWCSDGFTYRHSDYSHINPSFYQSFFSVADDGLLWTDGNYYPIGGIYFFTDQYIMMNLDGIVAWGYFLLNWRNGTIVYSDETSLYDLFDERDFFIDNRQYHHTSRDIAIHDFTVIEQPLLGTVSAPDDSEFTCYLASPEHLFACCKDSPLTVYDVTDPAVPILRFTSDKLTGQLYISSISRNGDVLTLTKSDDSKLFYDVSDPESPVQVSGDHYPGEVFGNFALNVAGNLLTVYRVRGLDEFELLGQYTHGQDILAAKKFNNGIVILDDENLYSLVDLCAMQVSAVHDPQVPAYHVGGTGVAILSVSPNPFNPSTTIVFALDKRQTVRLDVYDMAGRHVKTLARRVFTDGEHQVTWKGEDKTGRTQAAGIYIVMINGEAGTAVQKITLLK